MERTFISTVVLLLLVVGVPVGLAVLEIFLARLESRWPGLVPPGITFLWSLILCLIFALQIAGGTSHIPGAAANILVGFLLMLLFLNVPTLILLAVYYICREKKRKKKMLDKMNIRDLD